MSGSDIALLVGAIVGAITAIGAGVQWLLSYIKGVSSDAALKESEARAALSTRLHDEISVLRLELAKLQALIGVYQRRIYQLESFIHQQPGIQIPVMDGWPPS